MFNRVAMVLVAAALAAPSSVPQEKKGGTKSVMHDLTVTTTEEVYTGTMDLAVDSGTVTGKMVVTSPTEVTGAVAGTSKAGVMTLEFPYHMTERNSGLAKGTMEAVGCGREPGDKLTGTVELKPSSEKPAAK
jgi:hypothetical protein